MNSFSFSAIQHMINQQPAHQQQMHQPSTSVDHIRNNGQSTLNSSLLCSTYLPFKLQKTVFDRKQFYCINKKPYDYSEQLMTLSDLILNFYPGAAIDTVHEALESLGVTVYKAGP